LLLVILFGPDGAGKTTLAKTLIKELKKAGRNVIYTKMRLHHLIMYLVLRLLQNRKYIPKAHSPRIIDYGLRAIFRRSRAFLFLEFLNLMLWSFLFVKLRLIGNNIIIADRFSPDSVVSLHIISGNLPTIYKKILLSLCKGSIAIYVRAEPHILLLRKADEKLSESYLRYLLVLYDSIARELALIVRSMLIIDTTKSSEQQPARVVVEFVKRYL
jgi:thymidylate kinase